MPVKNNQFCFSEELLQKFRRQHLTLKEDYVQGWRDWSLRRVFADGTQIYTRKFNSNPLKTFCIQLNIDASMNFVLASLLHHRHLWDLNVTDCHKIGPSGQNFDIRLVTYQDPNTDYERKVFLARRWSYGDVNHEPICSLIERSIVPLGLINLNQRTVYKSSFLISQLSPGRSQLIYLACIDLRSKSSQWYDGVYGEMLVQQLNRLKLNLSKCQIGTLV